MHGSTARTRSLAAAIAAVAVGVAAFVAAVDTTPAAPAEPGKLVIMYTSRALGTIRSCNCTKFRFGGYARQATFLDQARKEIDGLVLIEGGDTVNAMATAQDKLKAEVSLQLVDTLGYNALVPGEREIYRSIKLQQDLESLAKTPVVLANVCKPGTDESVCKRKYQICTQPAAGGARVAVVGVLGSDVTARGFASEMGVEVLDPVESVKKLLPELAAVDLVMVVSHSEPATAKKIAAIEGVGMVLCVHTQETPFPEKEENVADGPVETIGDCLYIESGVKNGWSVGRLDVTLAKGEAPTATHKLIYLDRSFEEKPEIVEIYDDYNKRVRDQAVAQGKKLRAQFDALARSRGFDPSQRTTRRPTYAGAEACKNCHTDIFESWSKTRHAHAIDTLKKTKQEYDPECARCHTTSYGRRGGFITLDETPQYANVQCESCHGAGALHAANPGKGYGAVGEQECMACHTEDLDPEFDYDTRWESIKH